MKRRNALIGFLVVLIAVFAVQYYLFHGCVTYATYMQIKSQMTKPETHRILGAPLSRPVHIDDLGDNGTIEWWQGAEGEAMLHFDKNGMVIWKQWENRHTKENFFDRIGLRQRVLE